MIRRTRRFLRAGLVALCCFLTSSLGFAHPMGNFSISHYSGIRIERGFVEIRYLIDMAEIPTFQEIQQNELAAKPDDPTTRKYISRQAQTFRAGLRLTLNGHPLAMRTESAEVIFPAGAGGLPTMKMSFLYRAALVEPGQVHPDLVQPDVVQPDVVQPDLVQPDLVQPGQPGTGPVGYALYYRDDNFASRVGWKEVVATAGRGVTIVNASVPQKDRSRELSNYPTDLLNSPPVNLEAKVSLRWDPVRARPPTPAALTPSAPAGAQKLELEQKPPGTHKDASAPGLPPVGVIGPAPNATRDVPIPESSLQSNKQATPQSRFTQLMTTRQFGLWFLVMAAAIAAGLGALHALEPGHGKTIVAAYLVGSKGTARHAFLLGLIVTASHTASVYALGAVTLYASRYIVPDQLYPWLGAISGLLIAALGSYLFLQRYAGHEVGHSHGPGGHHHHGDGPNHTQEHTQDHTHADGVVPMHAGHTHAGHTHQIPADVSYRQLLALGITGGIVPCPAALVVLLSAVALNRIWFGLFLIVAFSLGLAAVLIAVGMLMVYARRFMTRFRSDGLWITRWLPLTSAAVITILGLALAVRSLVTGGILQIRL